MRIGVNAGSLERELLEKYGEPCPRRWSDRRSITRRLLEDHDFREFKISVKASDAFLAVAAYQAWPKPATIRFTSASPKQGPAHRHGEVVDRPQHAAVVGHRRHAARVAVRRSGRGGEGRASTCQKSLNLRHRGVNLVSCPSCARQNFDVIKTVEAVEKRIGHITTPMSVQHHRLRCQRPGEARETDIGFTGGGNNTHMVYLAGQRTTALRIRTSSNPWWRWSKRRRPRSGGEAGRQKPNGPPPNVTRLPPADQNDVGLQPVRGTRPVARGDAPPSPGQRHRAPPAECFGYQEIATPIFEFSEVSSARSATRRISSPKEMYTFTDRGGETIAAAREHRRRRAVALISVALAQHRR